MAGMRHTRGDTGPETGRVEDPQASLPHRLRPIPPTTLLQALGTDARAVRRS